MLRVFAMLVSHVARRFASRNQIPAAECDGDCDPMREANVVLDRNQEQKSAAASSATACISASSPTAPAVADKSSIGREALMVSSVAIATRPSNHEGGLTALSTSHSRASEARHENLWATRGSLASALAASKILGSSPRMTRRWVCWENHQACLVL